MPVRRALVDCAVLSVQGAHVFYPCCINCFSRIDVEQRDTSRCRCFKCGYSYMREHVEYRYRLSLRVARDTNIFGVTVFGSCLNPFFGIHASGLQRLVENSDGPVGASTRSALLLKSVKDCFIGRHFIFGLKVTETENVPWFGGPAVNGSSSKGPDHFIATQMILPRATGLAGCTVVSYYRILLQKAAEYEQGSTDPSKTSRPPATTLLLIPHRSPPSNNSAFCSSGLLSQSLLRSQYHDCSLTPTPPWQQSLGLVTSSAEQEESCSTQHSGDETSRTPHHAERSHLEDHRAAEEAVLSPFLSSECSSYSLPLFPKHPHSSVEKAVGNTPIINTWFSPSPPGQNISKRFSTRRLTETFLKSSMTWEDFPFSESLTDFLSEEKDFDVLHETEPHQHVQSQNLMTRNNQEISKQAENLSMQSTSVCQNYAQITDGHSRILLDITNASAVNGIDRHELSDQYTVGCVNKSQARNICSQDNKEASLLSFENKEEEQLEGDTYNCSADLFSSSLVVDFVTDKLSTCAESVTTMMSPEAFPVLSKPDRRHVTIEKVNVPHSTLDKPKLSEKSVNRDSLIPSGTQELDFIPPSQSTPIVKGAVSGSPASYRTLTFGFQPDNQDSFVFEKNVLQLDSQRAVKITSSVSKLNSENFVGNSVSSRHSHTFTPRRFWKPDKHKNSLLAQQHLEVQRGALNTVSTGEIKCNSSDRDVTVCDSEVIVVPQTPAVKTQRCEKLRRRRRRLITDANSSRDLGYTVEAQQDGVNCKITLLDQTLMSSQKGLSQTGNCDSETVEDQDGSNNHLLVDENKVCDWSKDLFSDSI